MELHWIESADVRGFDSWLRCLDISHWGMIVTSERPRWFRFYDPRNTVLFPRESA